MMSVTDQLTNAVAGLFQVLALVDSIERWRRCCGGSTEVKPDGAGREKIRLVRTWDRQKITFFEKLERQQRIRRKSEFVAIGRRFLIARRVVLEHRLLYPGASVTDWTRPEWMLRECELWWRDVKRVLQRKVGFAAGAVTFPEDIDDWKEELRDLVRTLVFDELVNTPASERQWIIDAASIQTEVPPSIHLVQLGVPSPTQSELPPSIHMDQPEDLAPIQSGNEADDPSNREDGTSDELPEGVTKKQIDDVGAALNKFGPYAEQKTIMDFVREKRGGRITGVTLRDKILPYFRQRGKYLKPPRSRRAIN